MRWIRGREGEKVGAVVNAGGERMSAGWGEGEYMGGGGGGGVREGVLSRGVGRCFVMGGHQ